MRKHINISRILWLAILIEMCFPSLGFAQTNFPPFPSAQFSITGGTGTQAERDRWRYAHMSVLDFKAKCDGVTDDTAAFNNALSYAAAHEPMTIYVPSGESCYIGLSGNVVLPNFGVTLQGDGQVPFQDRAIQFIGPQLLLDPSHTIVLNFFDALKNLRITRYGLSQPTTMEQVIAAINGWSTDGSMGVELNGDNDTVENVQIVGFNTDIGRAPTGAIGRPNLIGVQFDGAGVGIDLTRIADAPIINRVYATNLYSFSVSGYGAYKATVASQGSGGYTNGDTVTATGLSGSTEPQFTLTVSGGNVTAVAVADTGDLTAFPTTPVSVTGGSGSGLTLNLFTQPSGYRPGIAFKFHDKVDGALVSNLGAIGWQTGFYWSNVFGGQYTNLATEPGVGPQPNPAIADLEPIGFDLENCTTINLVSLYAQVGFRSIEFNQRSFANGGSCAGADNLLASATLDGALFGGAVGSGIYFGPYSVTSIKNVSIGQATSTDGDPITVGPLASFVDVEGLTPATALFPQTYVDPTATPPISAQLSFPGRGSLLLNGDFRIDQAHEGAANATNPLLDRWRASNNMGLAFTSTRTTSGPPGYPNSDLLSITTGKTPTAAQTATMYQAIEGPSIGGLQWGTSSAVPVILDYCAKANNTGTYGLSLQNSAQNMSYVIPVSITIANTWICTGTVVPGPTSGTWVSLAGNVGVYVRADIGSGSNFQSPSQYAWESGQYYTMAGYTELSDTTGATLTLGYIHLRPGPYDVPQYAMRPYGTELSLVQRYYQKSFSAGTAPAQNAGLAGATTMIAPLLNGTEGAQERFAVPMAAAPTVTFYNPSATNANCRDTTGAADGGAATAVNTGTSGFMAECPNGSAGVPAVGDALAVQWSADVGF